MLIHIASMPMIEPDEGRNADVARSVLESGDYVVPRFHGTAYLDKPILYFAAVASSFRALGVNEFAARLPSLLFALGTMAGTWLLGRRLLDARRAWLAVGIVATSPLVIGFARIVIFDIALTCWVVLSMLFAVEGARGWRPGHALAWGVTGLAVLTKGPVGLLLPVLGTTCIMLGSGRRGELRRYFSLRNVLLFPVVCLPWVIAVELRQPGFLRYALLTETVERLTQPTFRRSGPIYYYVPVLLLGMLPWSLVAVSRIPGWWRRRRELGDATPRRGLLLAAAAIVLFFSLSSSKLGGYVLPAIPLIALLLANEVDRDEPEHFIARMLPATLLVLLGAAAIWVVLPGRSLAWFRQPEILVEPLRRLLTGLGIVAVATGILHSVASWSRRRGVAFVLLAAYVPVSTWVGAEPMMQYAEQNSSRRIAEVIRGLGVGDDRIAARHCFPTGIEFYLRSTIPVVTETGSEITSNYVARNFSDVRHQADAGWMSPAELDSRVRSAKIDVLITRQAERPYDGFTLVERVGRYRIWSREIGLAGAEPLPPARER